MCVAPTLTQASDVTLSLAEARWEGLSAYRTASDRCSLVPRPSPDPVQAGPVCGAVYILSNHVPTDDGSYWSVTGASFCPHHLSIFR